MTTAAPSPDTATADTTVVDAAAAALAATSADVLTGLIAKGMLDEVGQPKKLPELLFPGIDSADVRRVWDLALAVGFRAGRLTTHRWDPAPLKHAQAALSEAGYEAMAASTGLTAAVVAPRRPADDETLAGGHA